MTHDKKNDLAEMTNSKNRIDYFVTATTTDNKIKGLQQKLAW